ncbi:MAG: hypothetical protein AAGA23_11975 [Pseudomonadota bacterium]
MKLTEDDLKRLVTQAEKAQAGAGEPMDGEFVARAAAGELSDEERARLPGLMARHPELAAEIALAVELHQGIQPESAPRAGKVAPRFLALAASLALAVAAAFWFARPAPDSTPQAPVLRSQTEQVEPADGAELTASPEQFRWEARSLRNRYRVHVLRSSGESVWQSDWVEGTTLQPEGLALPPGDYVWRVVARDDSNPGLAPSYAFSVRAR